MKRILLVGYFTIIILGVSANNYDSLIVKANKHYASGEYEQAISIYESVLTGYQSPELYYNLANAYYKAKKINYAILNYERAIKLSPDDEDIAYNLEIAQTNIVDKIEIIPEFFLKKWIKSMVGVFSSDQWAMLSIILFIAFLALLFIYLYTRSYGLKKASFWLGFLCLFIFVVSYVFAIKQKNQAESANHAIIFNPTVTVKSSPAESGTDLFLLHEGTKVGLGEEVGNWREIKLSDGNKGWVEKNAIEVI